MGKKKSPASLSGDFGCLHEKRIVLSSSGGRLVSVAADVDQFVGLVFLAPPLQIVVTADIGHSEISAYMALVGVPSAHVD